MLREATYEAIRERERDEPDVVEPVLRLLADPDDDVEVTKAMRVTAAALADERQAASLEAFLAASLPTAAVLERVRSWNDRRTVSSARQRGQLLGLTLGRDAYHPDWQFSRSGVRSGVAQVVGPLLEAAADDAILADRIMREPRPQLDGDSLADLLAAQRTDEVVTFLGRYRHGFAA